ncbi:MAG: hemolysin III family protein [Actinobacteria bacterium]|nr:hemolysin III family protein [Actinomycetota bacterium]
MAVVAGVALAAHARPDGRWTAIVFAATLAGMFTASSLYNIPRWPERMRRALVRVDNSTILLFIVGTFIPIAYHGLSGAWRTWSLIVAGAVVAGGLIILLSRIVLPRGTGVMAYVAIGWLAAVPVVRLAFDLPAAQVALLVVGGLAYTIGAVLFAIGRPNPWPGWFGPHEVFHLFVIAGTTLHYPVVWRVVG